MPTGDAAEAIVADGVGFTYGDADRPAIQGLDLRLAAGRVLLIVGPSGSGKSTIARAIAGLVPRDFPGRWAGTLRVAGIDTATGDRLQLASQVGIVFQDPGSQLVMDRVADDVAFGLENRAWPLAAMRDAVPAALADTGLAGFERRHGSRLSGGEQQRLALAGVMAARPSVLVLDEPTANLDPDGARAMVERLARIKASGETTIVLIEHHAHRGWPLADLVLALDGTGSTIDVGTPDEVLARSGDRLADAGIWLPAAGLGKTARRRSRRRRSVQGPPDGPVHLGIEPSWMAVDRHDPGLVEVRDLRFAYERDRPVVRDVHLQLGIGERVALVGPNGSGKSTLLRLLAGLLRPSGGIVRVAGRDPSRMSGRRLADLVGFVFQDPELGFIENTVAAEVALGARGRPADDLMARLRLPLEVYASRNPYRLSGGEQRRLSAAPALLRRPALLLLDEPTFGQDRLGWEAIADIVNELVEAGTTVVAATHDVAFAARIATRRIEMDDGWIVADEPVVRAVPEPVPGPSAAGPTAPDPGSSPPTGVSGPPGRKTPPGPPGAVPAHRHGSPC
ncbi:MAG: energy-coupling factor ABC transporter ATP-binding protein [Chloroflexota bacterium]|nr:MAG: energy-coupling factor ABC transporter ATP-binding protein [Chloroflexota bacterium]